LKDIQNQPSDLNISIETVGITNVKLPIFVNERIFEKKQHTVASIDVFVDLISNQKGIHMSRLQIELQKYLNVELHSDVIINISNNIRKISESNKCQIIYSFPYFITKISPKSNLNGMVYHNVVFDITTAKNQEPIFIISVETLATSLCPCSKEISDYGAHNQRSKIKIKCHVKDFIYIEDLVDIANNNSSCEIYSVLKRIDEKHVTEVAYNNPMFVEDISRNIFKELSNKIKTKSHWYQVEVSNEESIHQHNAYAKINSQKGNHNAF